jgi:predicted ATPase with chaperone activity
MSQTQQADFTSVTTAFTVATDMPQGFFPQAPKTVEDTGLNPIQIESLILKTLLNLGSLTGRDIAARVCLPFKLIDDILHSLKQRLLIGHKAAAQFGDFIYVLTDGGHEQSIMAREVSNYVGPAPVKLPEYVKAVRAQTITQEKPKVADLQAALSDLFIEEHVLDTLGPAINSARGLFLYGEPGNGKTSIAERICKCFKQGLWIPVTLDIQGQQIQLYDPQMHERLEPPQGPIPHDARWVYIKRPVVVVGGELTMDTLELKYNPTVKVCEAPIQMKSNGGTLLIDDFGRQRINPVELLNRWIIPLEKQIDYLTLPNGQKISVPFDQLIIFSTNLNPEDLVDEAFLRRIPYKINVSSPTEDQFKILFQIMCEKLAIPYEEPMLNYLIKNHYRGKRPFRACQARDLLLQIINTASYQNKEPQLTVEFLDLACQNYFSAMGSYRPHLQKSYR